jgi:hypothetical protein
MAGETTEIHAKLVLDPEAKEAAEHLKEGFEGIGEKVHEIQHEMMELVKTTLAVAAGFELDKGIESIKELGHEVLNAATASENAEKTIAGLLAMSDKTGASFEELKGRAAEVHEQLEDIGVKVGASGDAVAEAFEMISSRSQKSTEELVKLTDQMATAGKILPGGVSQIAAAWRDLESGIVRPRNALVQLMVQTHTVGGTMREVAAGMNKMLQTPEGKEKAFEMAEKAIAKMAETARNAPMSYDQLIQSLKSMREMVFKSAGEPIIKALGGNLEKLRTYFMNNQAAVEAWAKSAGEKVGEWVVQAADAMKEGFQYLQTHAEEIEKAIKSGVAGAKAMVEFILAHKEEIAIAFGVSKALSFGSALAGGSVSVVNGITAMAEFGITVGAATMALLAFTAAAASLAAVYLEWQKLKGVTGGNFQNEYHMDQMARMEGADKSAHAGNIGETKRITDAMVEENPALAEMAVHLNSIAQGAAEWNREAAALENKMNGQSVPLVKTDEAAQNMFEGVAFSFETAQAVGDTAAANFQAHFVAANQKVFDAMNKAGPDFDMAAWKFIESISAFAPAVAAAMATKYGNEHGTGTRVPTSGPPVMDFRGSNFTIHQDFRDQDPDRVVAMMRKDLVHTAGARVQSRGALGGGM